MPVTGVRADAYIQRKAPTEFFWCISARRKVRWASPVAFLDVELMPHRRPNEFKKIVVDFVTRT